MTSVHDWRERRCDEAWSESAPGLQAERRLLLTIAPGLEAEHWLLLTSAPWDRSRALTLVKTVRRAFRDRDPLTHRGEKSGHWWTRVDSVGQEKVSHILRFGALNLSPFVDSTTWLQRINSQSFFAPILPTLVS